MKRKKRKGLETITTLNDDGKVITMHTTERGMFAHPVKTKCMFCKRKGGEAKKMESLRKLKIKEYIIRYLDWETKGKKKIARECEVRRSTLEEAKTYVKAIEGFADITVTDIVQVLYDDENWGAKFKRGRYVDKK